MLADRDRGDRDLVVAEEVTGQDLAEVLDRSAEVLGCQRVDRVLHRVGRDDAGVVAAGVREREVALERDGHGQVADPMTIGLTDELDQADRRLAIAVRTELDHGVLLVRGGYQPPASRTSRSRTRPATARR